MSCGEFTVAKINRVSRQPRLFGGGTPKSGGEPSNKHCGNGGDCGGVIVKKFSDMPEIDKHKVISGAIFLIGLWVGVTYFAALLADPTQEA